MSVLFWDVLMVALTALAFWRGHSEERLASIAILLLSISNPLVQSKQWGPRDIEWVEAGCDVVLLGVLGYLAVARKLWWAIFAAGFQFLAILIHAARLSDPTMGRAAYAAAYNKYGYLVVAAILYGIWSRSRPSPSSPPAAPRSPW